MKKPMLAFTLSFLMPGAGLAYLGRWKWGFINLGIVLLIGVLAALVLSNDTFNEYVRIMAIACAVGSGGFARSIADQLNGQEVKRRAAVVQEEG